MRTTDAIALALSSVGSILIIIIVLAVQYNRTFNLAGWSTGAAVCLIITAVVVYCMGDDEVEPKKEP